MDDLRVGVCVLEDDQVDVECDLHASAVLVVLLFRARAAQPRVEHDGIPLPLRKGGKAVLVADAAASFGAGPRNAEEDVRPA